ncbi:MAG: hypothetical protein ABIM88_01430 [candidate division WOR-3 bacterium]
MLFIALLSVAGGMGGFTSGASFWDNSAISSRLETQGYDPLSSYGLVMGGGGYAIASKLLIGGSGFGASYPKTESDSATAELSVGGGFFEIGWLFAPLDWLWLYPTFGLGGMGYTLHLVPVQGGQNFDSLLANPRYSATLGGGGLSATGALSAQFNIPMATGQGEGAIIGIAIKGQMIYSPMIGEWQVEGRDVVGAPKPSQMVPLVTGTLMFGGVSD